MQSEEEPKWKFEGEIKAVLALDNHIFSNWDLVVYEMFTFI